MNFSIGLHEKDRALLERIQAYFGGVGVIYTYGNRIEYRVYRLEDLIWIIAHFDKYPAPPQG